MGGYEAKLRKREMRKEMQKSEERGGGVLETTDYKLFSFLKGNRGINLRHLKRLMDSIKEKLLDTVILVNERFEIIDGQHRFLVLQELGLTIRYRVIKGYGLAEVQSMNSNNKNWDSGDYLKSYVGQNRPEYVKFEEFKDRYGFNHNSCLTLLGGGVNSNGGLTKSFHRGDFKIKSWAKSTDMADKIQKFSSLFEHWKSRGFIYAMYTIFTSVDKFDFEKLLRKTEDNRRGLYKCVDTSGYLQVLEDIYNRGVSSGNRVSFPRRGKKGA